MAKIVLFMFAMIFAIGNAFAIGESAVITLVFPYSARSYGMGEVGTALADDEATVFFNPAGLGLENEQFKGGTFGSFYEQLIPIFMIKDLFHNTWTGCYQPNSAYGGFGFNLNYINMGVNEWTDELGRVIGRARSWEGVFTASWGFNFEEIGLQNRYFGLSLKYIHSALAPGYGSHGEGVARSFAFDFGFLRTYDCGLRFGTNWANLGPAVYYINENEKDPLPFTGNIALGYKKELIYDSLKLFNVSAEARFSREFVEIDKDGYPELPFKALSNGLFNKDINAQLRETNLNIGAEFKFFNSFAYRQGYLYDVIGQRYEMHFGMGADIFNHLQFDYYYIHAPEGYMKDLAQDLMPGGEGANGARHGQWGFNFTIYNMARWKEADNKWWMVN